MVSRIISEDSVEGHVVRDRDRVERFVFRSLRRQEGSNPSSLTHDFMRLLREGWEEELLPNLSIWLAEVFETGDGGSSSLALSTLAIDYAPPSDAEAAARLRLERERFLRIRRRTRDAGLNYGEVLQRVGVGTHDVALERMRLATLLGAVASHGLAQSSLEVPSRISMGGDYLLLMVLRRHDPTFEAYLDLLGRALPGFAAEPDLQGNADPLKLPVFKLREEKDWHELACVAMREWERTDNMDAKRSARKDALRCVLVLAGMRLEQSCSLQGRIRRTVGRPNEAISFLECTDDLVPEAEKWSRWARLAESVWT